MQEDEIIDDMVTKFTKITNDLSSLGDGIDNDQKSEEDHPCTPSILGSQSYNFEGAQQ